MSAAIGKPIVFWATKDRPSFRMRGRHIADELSARGLSVDVRIGLAPIALAGVEDSIVVCVKNHPRLASLARRGNRVVYDAIDYKTLVGVPSTADIVICGSEDMRTRIAKRVSKKTELAVVYHHADPALEPHRAGEDQLALVYSGEPENSQFLTGQIPDLNVVSFHNSGWREKLRDFNAHFSARVDRNKSVVKLANAAAMDAVYVAGPEPGCVELLGPDYPFFLHRYNRLAAVRDDITRLKSRVGTHTWTEARERVRAVRKKVTLSATADAYQELLSTL